LCRECARVHIIPAAISARRVSTPGRIGAGFRFEDPAGEISADGSRRRRDCATCTHTRACLHVRRRQQLFCVTPRWPRRAPARRQTPAIKTPHHRRSPHSAAGKWCVCMGTPTFVSEPESCSPTLRLDTGEVSPILSPFLINFWGVLSQTLPRCCLPLFIFHSSSNIS
jgi:hypothetical protein